MEVPLRKRNVYRIASSAEYIAALGYGITIWKRSTFELVHQFTGIRHIHGGFFLNDDVLVVFTGEQRLYFFQISEKRLLWECPRPRQLAPMGDMQCCQIPGTDQIACIAAGKQSLEEHFLLLVNYKKQTFSLHAIPDCRRVILSLVWEKSLGLALLSYEANVSGGLACNIIQAEDSETFSTLYEWECGQSMNAFSGKHLFLNDYRGQTAQVWMRELVLSEERQHLEWGNAVPLPIPFFKTPGPVGTGVHLPYISYVDESSGLLTACTLSWIGVCDFRSRRTVAEFSGDGIYCGIILDGNLLIGTSKGIAVERLH